MNAIVRNIKLMADYGCWCLWDIDDPQNISPETLPLSISLKAALREWELKYDATLDRANPIASGFSSTCAAVAFNEEGWRLWERLRDELPNSNIMYFDNELGQVFRERPSR